MPAVLIKYILTCTLILAAWISGVPMVLTSPAKMKAGNIVLSDNYINDSLLIQKHGVHVGTFQILPVSNWCQIRRCHTNTQDAIAYHSYCFSEHCHYGEYHCVSGQGTIAHFCAMFDDCRPLHRHVPVLNRTNQTRIEIFEVPCEHGFYQRNDRHSCFSPCVKDESRDFYDQGEGLPQRAYCVTKYGCNVYGKMFFHLDTPDDDCSGKPRCKENEDPLPDCSCDAKCPQGETRQPSTRFKCTEINSVVEPDPSSALENDISTTPRKVLTDADEDTSHKVQDESYHEVNEEESPNDDNINSRSNEGNNVPTIIVITGAICFLLFAAGLGVVAYRRRRIDRRNDNNERLQSSSTGSLGPVENRFVEGSEAVEPEFAPEDASSSLGVRMNELKDCQCSSLLARSQTDLKEEISSQPV